MARERVLPSKAQMINLIKIIKRNDEKSNAINEAIIRDLQEALNFDLEEKRNAILEGKNLEIALNNGLKVISTQY